MKTIITFLSILLVSSLLYSQSKIVFDTGTNIDVGTGADVCAGTITVNGTFTGSGTFCSGPLPVELASFNEMVVDDKVELKWQTATEVNNYGFDVEREAGSQQPAGSSWVKIGFVKGSGNSNSQKNYSFTDEPEGGAEFQYRLKQLDVDGTFKYSEKVTVVLENIAFKLEQNYPNPFNPVTTIKFALPEASKVSLKIFSAVGEEVAELVNEEKPAGYHQVEFNATKLSSGIYFYELNAGTFRSIKKMILLK